MSNFIDKTSIPIAVTTSTKLDLGHQHITTGNFMQINPILCTEMVPGESIDVNLMTFSKLQPLAVPTFGRANIKERAFFVPMRTIWRAWTDFITDTVHIYSDVKADDESGLATLTTVPTIANYDMLMSFLVGGVSVPFPGGHTNNEAFIELVENPTDESAYDIVALSANGTVSYIKLTSYGRQWLKILESLGYKLVWDERNTDTYSALPIMAMVKIILDWYFPSQYINTGDYINLMSKLVSDEANVPVIDATWLALAAKVLLYANYDSDYFTSAWDTPTAPSQGVYSKFTFVDVTNNTNVVQQVTNGWSSVMESPVNQNMRPSNGTPYVGSVVVNGSQGSNQYAANGVLTQYVDHALHLLTDYVKRHQLAGNRSVDRYLARFGKNLAAEKLNRCNYIGSKVIPLQIGDVYSTSAFPHDGFGGEYMTGLGDFSGKGQAFEKNFSFDWSTDEYGYLIVLSTVIPAADIWQGIDRKVMHKSKTDFFTPEFDSLSVQAISVREVYNDMTATDKLSNSTYSYMGWNNVFGFAPRYGEYKYANSQLTGDFVCNSLNVGSSNNSAWHMMRTFTYQDLYDGNTYNYSNLVHSRDFVSGLADHYQYNRIFTYMADLEIDQPDPFTFIYDFQMVAHAPMKALYENYDWDQEDEGRRVTQENNGVKVN